MQHIIVLEKPSNCDIHLFREALSSVVLFVQCALFFHYSSSRSSFHCFSHYTNHIHIPGILKYFVMIPICLGSISSLIYSEQTGFFHLLIYAGNEALPLTISIIHQVTGPSHLALLSCHRVRSAEALARHEKYLEKQSSWWGSMGIFTWNWIEHVYIYIYKYKYIMCMIPMCIKVGGCISTHTLGVSPAQ